MSITFFSAGDARLICHVGQHGDLVASRLTADDAVTLTPSRHAFVEAQEAAGARIATF